MRELGKQVREQALIDARSKADAERRARSTVSTLTEKGSGIGKDVVNCPDCLTT